MTSPSHLEIIPLGGLGEFGMNLMVYRWGRECLVVDAGMMFPDAEHFGIDVIIPDLSFLDDCGNLHGVILTHGHEDHIGALPYLLARHDVPVYATPFTDGLVRRRLSEHSMADDPRLQPMPASGEPLRLGPFMIEALPVAHSIPQSRMLVIRTPVGTVVHTADFKLDPVPTDGSGTDLARLAEIGREGVVALLSDSTNADRPGFTPPERSVAEGIRRIVAGQRGRVFVTTFASHVHRLQQLAEIARDTGRKLTLVGSSIERHAEVAQRLGLLHLPEGSTVAADSLMDRPPESALVVVSGSQGEPMSAMARIAVGNHRHVGIGEGDLVIHSARVIPGNGRTIGRMLNHLMRRGADVLTAEDAPVHTSGHASRDELLWMLRLLRPRHFLPIHGEYRQLRAHAALARDAGLDADRVALADSGDVVALRDDSISLAGRVHVGQVLIDAGLDEVDWKILRDRRRIAGDGIVVPVVALDRESGVVNGYPEILARGFVPISDAADDPLRLEARKVVADSLRQATAEERSDEGLMRARVQSELRRFLRRRTQRQPLVIPVIVEL